VNDSNLSHKCFKKGAVCFCIWSIYFSTNLNLDGFFSLYLPYIIIFISMLTFLCLLPFPSYKGVKIGPVPKIYNFYFKSNFDSFSSLDF